MRFEGWDGLTIDDLMGILPMVAGWFCMCLIFISHLYLAFLAFHVRLGI